MNLPRAFIRSILTFCIIWNDHNACSSPGIAPVCRVTLLTILQMVDIIGGFFGYAQTRQFASCCKTIELVHEASDAAEWVNEMRWIPF